MLLQLLKSSVAGSLFESYCLSNQGREQACIAHGGQRHEADATGKIVGKFAGGLQGKTRFPDPTWAGQSEELHIGSQQQFFYSCNFLIAADEGGALRRKIYGARRCVGRERIGETIPDCGQLPRKITSGSIALLRVLRKAAFDNPVEWRGAIGIQGGRGVRVIPEN